jgi:di/tricarboxylate transporter
MPDTNILLVISVVIAASTSFATPIGYQTNTMIHAQGYMFIDYTRVGGPLNLIFWAL